MNTGIKNKTFTYAIKWWGGLSIYKVTFKQILEYAKAN